MAASNESADRRMVPRWRFYAEAVKSGELGSNIPTEIRTFTGESFIEEKELAWKENQSLHFAVDLVGAALVLGRTDESVRAAEFVLGAGDDANPLAREIASRLLGTAIPVGLNPSVVDGLRAAIKFQKQMAIQHRRSPFVWADLARLYVLIGQLDSADRSLRVARGLAPYERYIARSSVRFLLHAGRKDEALNLIRTNPKTIYDPWMMAAEIATSSVLEKSPKFYKAGLSLINNDNIPLFHRSEVTCALASVEIGSGKQRKGNALLRKAAKDPSDNALAQIMWASKRFDLGEIPVKVTAQPNFSEARAFEAWNQEKWKDCVSHAEDWAKDEAFSARPFILASAVASGMLGDFTKGESLAKLGMTLNNKHPSLVNNLAFALISNGKPIEGLGYINQIDIVNVAPSDLICLAATAGFAYFRLGRKEEGIAHYEVAIQGAKRRNNHDLAARAELYLSRELVLSGDHAATARLIAAIASAKQITNSDSSAVAAMVESEMFPPVADDSKADASQQNTLTP